MGLKDIVDKLNNTYLAWSVFAAGTIGDYASTAYCLENVPGTEEGNSKVSSVITDIGLHGGLIATSLLGVSITAACYLLLKQRYNKSKACNLIPFSMGAIAIACTVNNLGYILK